MITASIHVFHLSPLYLLLLSIFPFHLPFPTLRPPLGWLTPVGRLDRLTPCRDRVINHLIMNIFETGYSRNTGRRLASDPQLCSLVQLPHSPSAGAVDHDQHPPASSRSPSSWKAFYFQQGCDTSHPRGMKKSESADADMTATKDAETKPGCRRSMPGGIMEETTFDVRIHGTGVHGYPSQIQTRCESRPSCTIG